MQLLLNKYMLSLVYILYKMGFSFFLSIMIKIWYFQYSSNTLVNTILLFTIFIVLNSIKYVFYITVNISVADSLQKIIVDMNKISIYWSFRLPGISYKKISLTDHWLVEGIVPPEVRRYCFVQNQDARRS